MNLVGNNNQILYRGFLSRRGAQMNRVPRSGLYAVAIFGAFFQGFFVRVAGQPVDILQEISCSECGVVTEWVLTIDGREGALGLVSAAWGVAQDSSRRLWISFQETALVNVFDRSGKFVDRVGRRGEGPGEFLGPTALVSIGDSILVFDPRQQRVTVVGPDLKPGRNFRFVGEVFSGAALEWPRVVINAALPAAAGEGRPYHILNLRSERIENSFGEVSGEEGDRERIPILIGNLALDPETGDIWTTSRHRLRIERWTTEGDLLQTFAGNSNLFPEDAKGRLGDRRTPPDPRILRLLPNAGSLLVFFLAPRPDWREAWLGHPRTIPGHGEDLPDLSLLLQGKVALIDPSQGSIRGVWDTDLRPLGFGHIADEIVSLEPEMDFFQSVSVHRVRAQTENGPRPGPTVPRR